MEEEKHQTGKGKQEKETTNEKRPRAGSGGAFLQSFWDLALADTQKRLSAASHIVDHLVETQGGNTDSIAPDVSYAVKRLARGLSSNREAARQGFGACLAEVLATVEAVSPTEVLQQIVKETETRAKMRGSEERDALLGRLFGCAALVRSGRLAAATPGAENADAAGGVSRVWAETFTAVVGLYGTKSWIQEACVDTLLGLLWQVPPSNISQDCYAALGGLLGGAEAKIGDFSPEQLQLALGLHRYFQTKGEGKVKAATDVLPKMVTIRKPMLRPGRMMKVIDALKKATYSFPKVHSVFQWAFASMVAKEAGPSDSDETLELLKEFWTTVIDGILANGTHQTKGITLLLVQLLAPSLSPQELSLVLSPAVVRTLVNATKRQENHLYSTARQTLARLVEATSESPSCRLAAVTVLISDGHMDFDKVTKTPTVANLLQGLDKSAVAKYITFLQNVICKPEESQKGGEAVTENGMPETEDSTATNKQDARKLWAIESLYAAVARNSKLQGHKEWVTQVAQLLLAAAFYDTSGLSEIFNTKKSKKKRKESMDGISQVLPSMELSTAVRERARRKLFALATDYAMDRDGISGLAFLTSLHEFFKSLKSKGAKPIKSFDEESQAAQEMVLQVIAEGETSAKDHKLRVPFSELLLLTSLQLFEGEDEDTNLDEVILDLCKCFQKLLGMEQHNDASDSEGDESEEDPMAVFADAAISILSAASEHCARGIREVVKKAWGAACSVHQLGPTAFSVLVDAICADEDSIASQEQEDEEDKELESEEKEENPEEMQQPRENAEDKAEEPASESEEDEEEDDDDEKVDEEGLMDLLEDRAMDAEAQDNALAAMLALRKSVRKSGQQDQERARCQLGLRVLDLLELVFQKQRDNPVVISQLAQMVRGVGKLTQQVKAQPKITEISSLLQRLTSLIQNKTPKCNPKLQTESEVELAQQTLVQIMEAAKKFKGNKVVACALSCCVRALQHSPNPQESNQVIQEVYGEALKQYSSVRSSHLHSVIFTELAERFPSLGLLIMPNLVRMAQESRTAYLRSEAFRMISILLRRRSNLDKVDQQLLKTFFPQMNETFLMILLKGDKIAEAVYKNRMDTILQMALALYQSAQDYKWKCEDHSRLLEILSDQHDKVPKKVQHSFTNLIKLIKAQQSADPSKSEKKSQSTPMLSQTNKKRKKRKILRT